MSGKTVNSRRIISTALIGILVGIAVVVLIRTGYKLVRPTSLLSGRHPPPPPLITLQPSQRANVLVLPVDTAPGDSVRAILQRDLNAGGWIHVLPLDSALHSVAVLHATKTQYGLHVDLIDGKTLGVYRSQDFPLRDSTKEIQRWDIHRVADAVQEWITGRAGAMQSRIAYVSRGTLHVVDADGANDHVFLSPGIALSPSWSHDGCCIVYSEMTSNGTRIMELDLLSGAAHVFSNVPRGLNITPVYSPDDRWIVFAHGDDRGTNLVALRRDSAAVLRAVLPRLGFDNSSPAFSPDGRRIAFVSARPKTPQIYSVSTDGDGERVETPFSPKRRSYRSSPDWSPDGETIAFEQQNGDFQVWLLTLANHHMRRVTSEGENEDPSWSPDSRHIAFTSTRKGSRDIWVLDTYSGALRQLTHAGDARLAAWSIAPRKKRPAPSW